MSKVSVIIPAYNVESYIEQCAKSVLYQTLEDIEVIFIDDGSTDKTGDILDRIVLEHDNAIVIHQKNEGLYKTREIGLEYATGEYIGWIDADDFVEKNMYETLYNLAIEYDSELVICNYSWFPRKISTKEKWFRMYSGKVDVSFVERNTQLWNKIVKRELIDRLKIGKYFVTCFDEIYIKILMEAKNPVTLDQSLYYYRVGQSTMSSTYTNISHYRKFVNASKELKKVMQPFTSDSYWIDYYEYRIAYYLIMTMIVAANAGDKNAYYDNRQELLSMKPNYNRNQHFWKILKENYGIIKAIAIGKIIPLGYPAACIACVFGLKK